VTTNTLIPGGSVVDVVGTLVDTLRGALFDPHLSVTDRLVQQHQARASTWAVTQVVMSLLALLTLVPIGRSLRRTSDEESLALDTGKLIVAVLTLASPRFQSWYLLMALPFFGLSCPPPWRRWWLWAVATSVTTGFALALPREARLFVPYVAVSGFASVSVFLVALRARFGQR
jgi:hypothetical protein